MKWKHSEKAGFYGYDFGIVSSMSMRERWVEKDDRPKREGKITIYMGYSRLWMDTANLILVPLGTSILGDSRMELCLKLPPWSLFQLLPLKHGTS